MPSNQVWLAWARIIGSWQSCRVWAKSTILARDLSELMDELNLEKASLLGWFMWVMVIWDYIRQFGYGRIERLFIEDMSPKTVNEGEWTYGLMRNETFQSSEGFAALVVSDWQKAASMFIPGIFANA